MTTYTFTLELDENEFSMIKDALDLMLKHCDSAISAGNTEYPNLMWRKCALNVRARLFDGMHMSSCIVYPQDNPE